MGHMEILATYRFFGSFKSIKKYGPNITTYPLHLNDIIDMLYNSTAFKKL